MEASNTFGRPAASRETPDAEQRARARERAARTARRGTPPSEAYSADDLRWAFRGREAELAELDELAERVRDERRQREDERDERRALRIETEKVLREMREADEAKLRQKAEAEARKRLGLAKGGG